MEPVRELIFREVRRDILACRLKPGEELTEGHLALRFGVSKSPVRDAMQKLEHEGLIEIAPRRGHRVRPVSAADAEDLIDLRIILETAAVRLAAERADGMQLKALDEFRTADTTSMEAFAVHNSRFHSRLSELSGNARIVEQVRSVMENYARLCIISLGNAPGRDSFSGPLRYHRKIIDAVQLRNGKRAAELVAMHVERSRAAILRGLGGRAIVQ